MPRWSQLPRPLLTAMAIVLATGATCFSALWMYTIRHQKPPVELGFEPSYTPFLKSIQVLSVYPQSPAESAGLRAGDQVVAINGRQLENQDVFNEVWWNAHPGDVVELTVLRPGSPQPILVRGNFRQTQATSQEGLARTSALQVLQSYPLSFLLVGLPVLFLRREDGNAWLLMLMFCGMIAAAPLPTLATLPPFVRLFFYGWRAIFLGSLGAVFYVFFAVFPAASPLERRVAWLKWAGLAQSASVALPGLRQGEMAAPQFLANWIGSGLAHGYVLAYTYGFIALGLVSLIGNAISTENPVASRKSRLILWGTAVGVLPVVAEKAAMDFAGFQPPFWLDTTLVINVAVFPLSFAYVVVKHRVMEIPVLLKRSARYIFVQRGFLVLLFLIASVMIAVFTNTFSRFFSGNANVGMALSAIFGIVLVWTSAPLIRKGTDRIDRAFFRSAYDARRILQDLADKARTTGDRHQLAALLEQHCNQALQPKFVTGFLEAADGRLAAEFGPVPPRIASLDTTAPLLSELVRRGKPWELPPAQLRIGWHPSALMPFPPDRARSFPMPVPIADGLSAWEPLEPECLVPILGRDNRLIGLLALGERRSEEPYSSEDMSLLEAVASQVGVALENIRLAESIAERMEVERRAAHEVEIAREVQSKLFPQKMPPLRTLDYSGGCIQARVVGGDYYDFLDLGPGRLAIVLADIAGKGISGALLMANLQANLRSQYALALEDLPRLLQSVNRLFRENTPDDRFATMFFADYADAGRRLRYVNCGHNPPLLLRADSTIEKLKATATVLGMFPDWQCEVEETTLEPGDVLVLYTDGVSEAPGADGDEFGEARLLESIRSSNRSSADVIRTGITADVQRFSSGAQADDITLVVACAR